MTKSHNLVHIASEISKNAHEGQYRLDAEKRPYIVHPALAANLVEKLVTTDPEIVAGAWLHDVIEDTPIKTEKDFLKAFADYGYKDQDSVRRIYALVKALSMPDDIVWDNIRSFQIDEIAGMSDAARVLKIADQVANYLDGMPAGWSDEKIRNYAFKAADICAACAGSAPYIYKLFQAYCAHENSLSRHDISRLINEIADEASGNLPVEIKTPDTVKATQEQDISEDIMGFYQDQPQHICRVRIYLGRNKLLADEVRQHVEDTGIFVRTLPSEKQSRDLVFEQPVQIEFLRNRAHV